MRLSFLLVAVWLSLLSCSSDEGCTKDTDCKGERVCDRGQCVMPQGSGGGPTGGVGGTGGSGSGGKASGGWGGVAGCPSQCKSPGGTCCAGA